MKRRITIALTVAIVITLLVIIPAMADSKDYHSYTTITYNNTFTDQGATNWNGGYSDTASNSIYMDLFGLNVWTTYTSCNDVIQYDHLGHYEIQDNPWMYQYDKNHIGDGMACVKSTCPSGQTRRLVNIIQHYWQDNGYSGDGGTITKKVIN
jgi:hypothetical protein